MASKCRRLEVQPGQESKQQNGNRRDSLHWRHTRAIKELLMQFRMKASEQRRAQHYAQHDLHNYQRHKTAEPQATQDCWRDDHDQKRLNQKH